MTYSKTIHLILQGKGGVGKSFTASVLTQFLLGENMSCQAIDTDPLNDSLSQVKNLATTRVSIYRDNSSEIDPTTFDNLLSLVLDSDASNTIIDNGAASFIPLSSYLVENEVVDYLAQQNIRTIIHCPIVAGASYSDTLQGFDALALSFGSASPIVVWLNPYFENFGEKYNFFSSKTYKLHQAQVPAVVTIPPYRNSSFKGAIAKMLEEKLTLAEAIENPAFHIMERQRLVIFRRELFENLSVTLLPVMASTAAAANG